MPTTWMRDLSSPMAAKWLGMKMKKILKATEPAASSAKPLHQPSALVCPKSGDWSPDHLPGLLDSEELTGLAHSAPNISAYQSQGQRQNERQPPPASIRRHPIAQ